MEQGELTVLRGRQAAGLFPGMGEVRGVEEADVQGYPGQRAGTGAQGLAGGKTLIVVVSRGGIYSTSEGGRAMEHQEGYLRTVFGFMGVTDVRFVRAEGVGMGPDAKNQALANAERDIQAQTAVAANQAQVAQAA